MAKDRSKVVKSLKKKGFALSSRKRDHDYYYYTDESTSTIYTKVSRGSNYKSIGDSLLGKMARQIHLDKKEFLQFVDCPLSSEMYAQILKDKGLL